MSAQFIWRTRFFLLVAWVSFMAAGAPQVPVYRATGSVVTVNVRVRNGRKPAPGLTASDFVLTDNKVPQNIESRGLASAPLDVTLALDVSASTRQPSLAFLRDIRGMIDVLHAEDRVRLITFAAGVHEVFGFQAAPASFSLDDVTTGGSTSLLDGILFALQRAPDPERQHLIVVLTDGGENTSVSSGAALTEAIARSDGVLEIVLSTPPPGPTGVGECRVPGGVWTDCSPLLLSSPDLETYVSPVWSADRRVGYWAGDMPRQLPSALAGPFSLPFIPLLRAAADFTGGEVHLAGVASELVTAFSTTVETLRQSYVLRYSPRGVTTTGWHDVVVSVSSHPDFEVTARKRYFGG